MHHTKLQRVSAMHWIMQKYFHFIVLPLTTTNRVPNTRWMESFILILLLLVAFFSYQTDVNQLFIYSLNCSVYAHSGHVLFYWLCFCVGFTVVCSRVQQKVVMRRWVKGQTECNPQGHGPQKWVKQTCQVPLGGQRLCFSSGHHKFSTLGHSSDYKRGKLLWSDEVLNKNEWPLWACVVGLCLRGPVCLSVYNTTHSLWGIDRICI